MQNRPQYNGKSKKINIKRKFSRYLVSCSDDMSLKIWDTEDSRQTLLLTISNAHTSAILRLTVMPDGTLISGAADSSIHV